MSKQEATLVLKLKNMASAGLKGVGGALKKVRENALAVGAAIGALGYAVKKSIDKFFVQEKAVARLDAALANVQGNTAGASRRLQELAAALQKTTTFGDEQIISAQAMLSTFQLTEKQITAITLILLDMAAATEKATGQSADLEAIAIALGKGFTGQAGSLSRYGVVLSDTTKKSGDFNDIIRDLDSNFKGIAESIGNTTAGRMTKLGNKIGDIQEKLGEFLVVAGEPFIGFLERVANFISNDVTPALDKFFRMIGGDKALKLTEEISQLQGQIKTLKASIGEKSIFDILWGGTESKNESILSRIDELNAMILEKQAQLDEINSARKEEQIAKDEEETARLQALAEQRLKNKLKTKDKESTELAKRKKKDDDAEIASVIGLEKFRDLTGKQRLKNTEIMLGQISALQRSHNKAAAAVGKAAAIANIALSTARGIMLAYGTFPFPIATGFAAAIGAAGAMQAAQAAGVNIGLAEGGIVKARAGGVNATIGEGGKDEAVIPLDDEESQERIGGTTIINFTVNGGLLGDATDAKILAKAIDKELYLLRKDNESVSFDTSL